MKRIVIGLFLATVIMLSRCTASSGVTALSSNSGVSPSGPSESSISPSTEVPQSVQEEIKELPGDFEWKTVSVDAENSNGFTYRAEIKISPWIELENKDVINSAWAQVGHNRKLPITLEDWGIKGDKDGDYSLRIDDSHFWNRGIPKFHYTVGEVVLYNTTEGWDLSEGRTTKVYVSISPYVNDDKWQSAFEQEESKLKFLRNVYYEKEESIRASGVYIEADMKSNQMTIPFVMAHGIEQPSPKYPKGKYYEDLLDMYFKIPGVGGGYLDFTIPVYE